MTMKQKTNQSMQNLYQCVTADQHWIGISFPHNSEKDRHTIICISHIGHTSAAHGKFHSIQGRKLLNNLQKPYNVHIT